MLTNETESSGEQPSAGDRALNPLQPDAAVLKLLREGAALASAHDLPAAAKWYASAADAAIKLDDRAGFGRAMAQLAALEESRGSIERAFACNQKAQETFLAIGDGAGLVQAFRVDGFLHVRMEDFAAAAASFAKAMSLALQRDAGMVLATLDQIVPVVRHLIDSDRLPALLPLGAALKKAVESAEPAQLPNMQDFSELTTTVGDLLAPLGVIAEEQSLTAAKRRELAARATHQAWLVDALTRKRWGLAELVKETLQTKLNFHENLD